MKKNLLLSLLLLFGTCLQTWAQDKSVTGKVTSTDDGSALPGVNVTVKGTTTGTATNIDGEYTISVPNNATLVFSFIGFTSQEVVVGNRSVIDVQLATDVQQLTEVVVTAVGIEREQKALGYSIEQVDATKVQQVSEPDVLRSLQGKVAG